jgi:hypothetical protein
MREIAFTERAEFHGFANARADAWQGVESRRQRGGTGPRAAFPFDAAWTKPIERRHLI